MKRFTLKRIVLALICVLALVYLASGMNVPNAGQARKGIKPTYATRNDGCYRINRAGERIPVRCNIRSRRAGIASHSQQTPGKTQQ